jgi:cytochrome b561
MTGRAPSRRYTIVAIALHWLIALGVLALIAIGLAMTKLGLSPLRQFQLYQLHKSIGITVLLLVVARIAWRLGHRPPPLPQAMPALERHAASAAHVGLYALIIGMPMTGWALVSSSRFNIPTVLYGVVKWPHLPYLPTLHDKARVEAAMKLVHGYGGWILLGLVALHAAAALRHHLVLRDDILWRMLPVFRRPSVAKPMGRKP